MDVQLSPTKKANDTTATTITHNSTNHHHDDRTEQRHCDEPFPVAKQQVVMRRDGNEAHEQKERPLSISQRIKQLQMKGLDKESSETVHKHNVGSRRPVTSIGSVK